MTSIVVATGIVMPSLAISLHIGYHVCFLVLLCLMLHTVYVVSLCHHDVTRPEIVE